MEDGDLRMAGVERGQALGVFVDGAEVRAYEGEHCRHACRLGTPLDAVDGAHWRAPRLLLRNGGLPGLSRHRGRTAQCARVRHAGARRHAGREPAWARRLAGESVSDVACLIIGGGPAGLAAARTAARHGVRVTLVDDNAVLGGQYYRQLPPWFRAPAGSVLARESEAGRALIAEVQVARRRASPGRDRLGDLRPAHGRHRHARSHRADPCRDAGAGAGGLRSTRAVPGWTLPGVMTAGGAQNLMKGSAVLPGRRVLVAGSGPLLLVVAHTLLEAGARVEAVCEAAPMRGLWRYAHRMLPHLDVVQQGYRLHGDIVGAGVPFLTGHVIRRALGDGAVTGAVVSSCDDDWTPLPGGEHTFEVDAVIVGYGFVSSLELSRLAGCEHRWDDDRGGWVAVRGRNMESTVPGVFIAGDGAGVAGSAVALAEGHLAGLTVAAASAGSPAREYSREASRARGRLLHLAGFRRVMDELYRFGPGLSALAEGETIMCRCEEIGQEEALQAVREGATARERGQGVDADRHGAVPGTDVRSRPGAAHRARHRAPRGRGGCLQCEAAREAHPLRRADSLER